MAATDIAIVGMSCYFPGANNLEEFWDNLIHGVSSITDAPEDRLDPLFFSDKNSKDIDRFYCRKGGFVPPLKIDPIEFGILPLAASGIDPEQLVTLHLVKQALTDAGVYEKKIPLQKCCFILGMGNFSGVAQIRVAQYTLMGLQLEHIIKGIFPELEEEDLRKITKEYQAQLGRYQADTVSGAMSNLAVSLTANKFDMKGPAYTLDGACASSLLAVDNAANLLLSGQCDLALAGGMHLEQGAPFWSIFHLLEAVSRKQQIAPFSEDADGLLIGEGAGIVVLKKLDKAIADKDRIYAVIKACSSSSDGTDVSVMAPSSKGQVQTLKLAWDKTGMDPQKIGYVETHGTATQVGDRAEMATLIEFFGNNEAPPALFGSVKSNIGHAMPAAGIAGLIKTALALYHKKIPPTLHCEKPMKAVFNSRFRPVQQLTDWDENKYPLVAAVNAFGFGGINAHAILEPYFPPAEAAAVRADKKDLLKDKVISLSAQTKKDLLFKLENEDYTVAEGNYRLVIFNPTADKLNRAKSLIEKDKPWKGRMDIWFSNEPLLSNGEKVVFMFAGFDSGSDIEVQSIAEYYDLPFRQVEVGKDPMLGHSVNHFLRSRLLDLALKKMGLMPDINIGHSLGEWHAAGAAGYVTSESIEKLIGEYNPEHHLFIDVIYIAIGCGYDKIKSWCETIPELYLANDNCPNQIVMAGREEAINRLKEYLKKEQIFYQILPFQSGFHTPLFPENELKEFYDVHVSILEYKQRSIPLWSSTILGEFPEEKEAFKNLLMRQLREPVRFRELIETLYGRAKARVFIQVGIGSLTGFVEDTLKEKAVSIIPTVHASHSGLEQLRRIAALLFIEGKTVNKELIGVVEAGVAKRPKTLMALDFSYKLVKELPTFQKVVNQHNVIAGTAFTQLPPFLSAKETDDPVLQKANNNLHEIAVLQQNMLEWYRSSTFGHVVETSQNGNRPTKITSHKKGDIVEKNIRIDLNDHRYLLDHMIVRQPANRPLEELNPLVPLTMTLEILSEQAQELDPGKKVVRVSSAGVQNWISVRKPFVAKMTGQWKTDDCISWTLPGYAYGDVYLGDEYPAVPEEYTKKIDLGDSILPSIPEKHHLYSFLMFHGPQYQSIIDITKIAQKGLSARICKTEGKGSLLDTVSQLLGLYCDLTLEENKSTFPRGVDEIIFYQDYNDQKGIFDCTVLITEINDNEAIGQVIIKRGDKVWCIANGWRNRRMNYDSRVAHVVMRPQQYIVAWQLLNLNHDVFYYYKSPYNAALFDFLYQRYLNLEERKHYDSLYPNQARDFLISRVALKDAVRKYIQKDNEDFIYPIEISVRYDERGKPSVYGHEKLDGLEISIAHKGSEAVARVSDEPVGIDIEKIEPRSNEFMEIAFTPHELDLLKEKEFDAEWIARFWVAKESYGKKLGVGLQGNPKQYEIESINGEILKIKNTMIETALHRNNFVIGWTL